MSLLTPATDAISSAVAIGGSPGAVLAIAVLLGARHAMDPDHLTAMSTLVLADRERSGRRAGKLGLFWGFGHAATLIGLGIPVVLFGRTLPEGAQRWIEFAIGAVIVALSLRLLRRWRLGHFHQHTHAHGGVWHTHPHFHEAPAGAESRAGAESTAGAASGEGAGHVHGMREERLVRAEHPRETHRHRHRSPATSFAIGLVHGAGGSAVAGLLVVAASDGWRDALVTLVLFAGMTALTMAGLTTALGAMLSREEVSPKLATLIPPVGIASLVFGLWYAAHTLQLGWAPL